MVRIDKAKKRLKTYKTRLAVLKHYRKKAKKLKPARRRRWERALKGMSKGARKGLRNAKRKVKALTAVLPSHGGWHPEARRAEYASAGNFTGGGKKIVWHTTEGYGLPSYSNSHPHFTLDPKTGELWQHTPINRAVKTLKAGGPNFWNTIQVELIGFAAQTQDWSDAEYERIARLARWIEKHGKVPRKCSVKFYKGVPRLSSQAFYNYEGHIGHCHVPGNDHWDPGAFKIDKVIR